MRKVSTVILVCILILALACGTAWAIAQHYKVFFDRRGALEDSTLPEIDSAQVVGDTAYLLATGALYRYAPGDVEPIHISLPGEQSGVRGGMLCSDGESLYLFSTFSGEGFRWDGSAWTQAFQLDLQGLMGEFGASLYHPVIEGDYLYVLRQDGSGWWNQYQLGRFSLATGAFEQMETTGLTQLMAYRDGLLLSVAYQEAYRESQEEASPGQEVLCLRALDTEGNVAAELATLPNRPGTFVAYEASQEAIFAASGGEFLRFSEGSWETVGYVDTFYTNNARQAVALPGDLFVLTGYDGVTVSDVSGAVMQEPPVRIVGAASNTEMVAAFRAAHPEIPVVVSDGDFAGAREMREAVRAGVSDADIFVLESPADLALWVEAGIAVPLDSAIIRETTARMYPQVQEALSHEGQIYGIPSRTAFPVLGQHPALVAQFGYDGAPGSVREYVEMLLRWQQAWQGDHGEYAFDVNGYHSDTQYLHLALKLALSQYAMAWPEDAGPVSLDTQEFREILSLITQLSSGNEPPENERNYMYPDTALFESGNWDYMGWDEPGSDTIPFNILPMPPFMEGASPKVEMQMPVYVLNPNGRNHAQALQVLEGLVSAIPVQDAFVLFPDRNDPVEYPDYQRMKTYREQEIEKLQIALEAASPEEQPDIEREIALFEEGMASQEKERWAYAPEQIKTLRELMPYATFRQDVLYYMEQDEAENAFLWAALDRCLAGELTVKQAVQEIDEKLRTLLQEM